MADIDTDDRTDFEEPEIALFDDDDMFEESSSGDWFDGIDDVEITYDVDLDA